MDRELLKDSAPWEFTCMHMDTAEDYSCIAYDHIHAGSDFTICIMLIMIYAALAIL